MRMFLGRIYLGFVFLMNFSFFLFVLLQLFIQNKKIITPKTSEWANHLWKTVTGIKAFHFFFPAKLWKLIKSTHCFFEGINKYSQNWTWFVLSRIYLIITKLLKWNYYRLNVCVSPKFICWNRIPSVMVLGKSLWEVIKSRGWSPCEGD